MNSHTILAGGLVALAIGGLFIWGRVNQTDPIDAAAQSASALTAAETFFDFGIISMADGVVEKVFEVTNSTGRDITLSSVTTSCMCTKAFIQKDGERRGPFGMPGHGQVPPANEVISAGETLAIAVVYDPNAHGPAGVGVTDRFIYLVDDAGGQLTLEIKAMVTP